MPRSLTRQLAPYLIALSVLGNICFGVARYNRDLYLNRYTWGNYTNDLWMYVNLLCVAVTPSPDGHVSTMFPQALPLAAESLEALQSLPDYRPRVDDNDMSEVQQFVLYAGSAYELAVQEQRAAGKISAESDRRLRTAVEGLSLILREQRVTQKLAGSGNPWDFAGWRAVWHRIATGLKAIDLVPLPE